MSIDIQLISFLIFFLYGVLMTVVYLCILRTKKIWCYPTFVMMTIIFMIVLYNVNGGIIHPYFITFLIIGIMASKVFVKFIKKLFRKLKQKWKR